MREQCQEFCATLADQVCKGNARVELLQDPGLSLRLFRDFFKSPIPQVRTVFMSKYIQ